ALIGINCTKIEKIIQDKNLNLEIANDNSPIQIVVSGLIEDINKSENDFLSNGVKKFIKLNVSSAFHSNFMKDAQEKLNYYINKTNFNESNISIISNFNASINRNIDDIVHCLKNQMANRVRWTESTKTLENTKEKKIIEIGPGKILSGLIKRISNTFDIISIDKIDDLKQLNNYEQN
ncbi:MAG: Polyketide biosynthesis protein BaeE, partial [Alphaproteobacteria bacterium MarineAlpha5_Bin5]